MLVRERLKALITEHCHGNQSELARRIGEHPNWVSWRVNGTTQIKADELTKIAEGLGVHPCDFFEPTQNERMNQLMRDELDRVRGRVPGPRAARMLADFLALEMGLSPEHVQAVTTIVDSLPRVIDIESPRSRV